MTEFNEIDVFRDAITDDNITVQIDAIKKLPALSVAVGKERTRDELLPCLAVYIDIIHEELMYHLAEQLEKFVPLVGGVDNSGMVLDILTKLSNNDETIVRTRAVQAIKNICDKLDNEQCEKSVLPFVELLASQEWFTSKCSALILITTIYPKISEQKQYEMKELFKNLAIEETPIVRRSAEMNLIDFVEVLTDDIIKLEFMPIFLNFAVDDQDTVRVLAVDVAIAIAKKLNDTEIHECLLKTCRLLSDDKSWRIRQRIALKIDEIQKVFAAQSSRDEILEMYTKCIKDDESEVRVVAAANLHSYCVHLKANFTDDQQSFDVFFEKEILSLVHHMMTDASEDVRLALSSNVLSLSTLINSECFTANIMPLMVDVLENDESMSFKESMLKNLNSLPADIDITKSVKSIIKVVENLLENSQLHWRTRRNLLLAFIHIIQHSTREFFDLNLKIFYVHLLSDQVFAIRRISPVILPIIIKQFGMKWATESLVPIFTIFAKNDRYLYRYIPLYAVNELIFPTLDTSNNRNDKYLGDLQAFISISSLEDREKYLKPLIKIVKLHEKLVEQLNDFTDDPSDDNNNNNNDNFNDIKMYGEDTLENLKKQNQVTIFTAEESQFRNNEMCYLEGLLLVLYKDFVGILRNLCKDSAWNVEIAAKFVVGNLRRFCANLGREIANSWVEESIGGLSREQRAKIDGDLNEELLKHTPNIEDDRIDLLVDLVGNIMTESLPDLGAEIPELVIEEEKDRNPDNGAEKETNNEFGETIEQH